MASLWCSICSRGLVLKREGRGLTAARVTMIVDVVGEKLNLRTRACVVSAVTITNPAAVLYPGWLLAAVVVSVGKCTTGI